MKIDNGDASTKLKIPYQLIIIIPRYIYEDFSGTNSYDISWNV